MFLWDNAFEKCEKLHGLSRTQLLQIGYQCFERCEATLKSRITSPTDLKVLADFANVVGMLKEPVFDAAKIASAFEAATQLFPDECDAEGSLNYLGSAVQALIAAVGTTKDTAYHVMDVLGNCYSAAIRDVVNSLIRQFGGQLDWDLLEHEKQSERCIAEIRWQEALVDQFQRET